MVSAGERESTRARFRTAKCRPAEALLVGGIVAAPIRPDAAPTMATRRIAAGLLALGTVALAGAGEALVLAHVGGALGLILLVCGAAAGIAGWVALGTPRTRRDISA